MKKALISEVDAQSDAYKNFITSLDSTASRESYRTAFTVFMKFCNADSYDALLDIQPIKKLESLIRDYIIYLREGKKASPSTVMTYVNAVTHFYEMNDVAINWKKLKKFKGKYHSVIEDVPYTRDQIKKLMDSATLRDRCIILLMASAGLRRGALPIMKLKDLQKIDRYKLYKITVYKKEAEQYTTYCTPECTRLINEYLDWRARLGEELMPNTILFRRAFDVSSPMIIARPRPLVVTTINSILSDLLDQTGIRAPVQKFGKSTLMTCHGFRKFFDTQCITHNMNPLYAEYLMGHKTGLIKSYFKPTDSELLEGNDKSLGYIAMIPYLTINATEEENQKLKHELAKQKQAHTTEWEMMRQQITDIRQKMGLAETD